MSEISVQLLYYELIYKNFRQCRIVIVNRRLVEVGLELNEAAALVDLVLDRVLVLVLILLEEPVDNFEVERRTKMEIRISVIIIEIVSGPSRRKSIKIYV